MNCAAQTLKLTSKCDLCWAEQVSELLRPDFEIDQLDMIYDGPGRSVNCAAQTLKLDPVMICEDMPVVDNRDIVLLIIPFQVHGIPHSRYRSSICFVYNIGPGLPRPCDYVRSLPVRLELSCRGVRSILKNLPQD